MNTTGETQISLNDEEARLFLVFRQHQDNFDILYKAGVFDLRNASATINFDSFGICDVKLLTTGYKKHLT